EQEAKAAAAAADAERLKAAREAERLREAEEAERAARLAAERAARAEAERLAKEEAERAARAEAERLAREEAERAARAEAERLARQETERLAKVQADGAAQAEAERAAGERKQAEQKARERRAAQTAGRLLAEQAGKPDPISPEVAGAPAAEADAPDSGSSLDELLEEIRRKREEERKPAGDEHEPEIADAAGEISHRNQVMGDLPAQTARRLKRLLQEDHNDLLDRVRTQRGKGSLEDNLAPVSEQLNRFVSGLGEPLTRAFVEGRRAAGAVSPVDASQAVTRLVTRQVLNPLRAEVSKAVEAGLGAQDSPSALSERVNDVFRVWKGVRTQLLGEGIAYAAYNQGVIDALGTSPAAQKLWVAADDEHECPNDICRRNASAGGVDLKSPFPSGHLAPPAHGGCTCTLKGS
ncbi:MAG TPA: hypothetical protein VM754_03855, partial [Actinomycetota bacterium]|nr:hypothetical protein [Actinomycetota bacterium]